MRSGALLGVSHTLETIMPFVRNVALARMLEPREFALALALTTVAAIAELTTDVGLPQYALKGELSDARFRGTLHTLALIRASVIGLIIASVALPLEWFFDAPGSALAFALAGLSVAIRGIANLGVKQLGREFRFAPDAYSGILTQVVFTLVVVGMSLYWADHRAMVAGLLAAGVTYVLASNLFSPMRFGLAWDRTIAADAARFGRPLIPNGMALAVTSLADRMIIGGMRGLESLALYGPLAATALLPRGTAMRYLYALFLPAMITEHDKGGDLSRLMRAWVAAMSLLAVAFSLGFMSLAQPVIGLVFGERYLPAPILTALMGALLVNRILVAYPVPLAMATGRTWFVTASSFITALSLVPAGLVLLGPQGDFVRDIAIFIAAMVGAEALGILVLVMRARKAFPAATPRLYRDTALAAALGYGPILAVLGFGLESWATRVPVAILGFACACAVFAPQLLVFIRRRTA